MERRYGQALGSRLPRMRSAVLSLVVIASLGAAGAERVDAASAIETQFKSPGPWATTTGSVTISGSGAYTLHYPNPLGTNHPILTWGNGTNANPSKYADTLAHLASWGFVIIASNNGTQGLGTLMLTGAQYMVSQNSNSSSIFYQRLNTAAVGAFGHSQGAGGTLNATLNSGGLIKSAVTIALPDPFWWTTPVPNLNAMTAKIFFIRGTSDILATEGAAQNWYNQVPGAAAKAARKSTGHNEIQANDNRLQGYLTAWLMYTLQGNTTARAAFVGSPPEINTNTNWQNQAEKNLP